MSRAQTLAKARAESRRKLNTKTPPRTGPFLAGNKLNVVLCVLLAAATIALYSPVLGYSFVVLDDQEYVTGNPHIQNGLAWSTVKWAFTSTETAAYWHPLTWLSHALDCQLFGLNPAGHHFDSVLIHALNAVLLFLLLAWVTKRVGPSLLVAALFALHPLNVESVAWVAERKNVLSTMFFLLAIAAYVRYAQKPDWRRYLLVAALFAAGLMAKPMVTTLPFVLLLLDYWPLDRTTLHGDKGNPATANSVPRVALSTLVLEKVPLLFLSAASAKITLIAQRRVELTFEELPLHIRIENAVVSYGLYLWKMLWPTRLAAFYPHPANTLPMWQVMLSGLILVGGTALVIVFHRKRYLPVGWFWFLGTLVPVIGLVQVWKQAMADRFAYVPLIGIFIMIAWGLDDWVEARKIRSVWRVIPTLCVLTALGCVTLRQVSYWGSQYDLWSRSLAVAESSLAHNSVGASLLDPTVTMTPNDLENFDTAQKRMDEARRHFERVLEMCQAQRNLEPCLPDTAEALSNLGFLDQRQNRPDETRRQHYEEALKVDRQLEQQDPSDRYRSYLAGTSINLGTMDLLQNRTDEARQHYEEALKIDRQLLQENLEPYLPDMAIALSNLGTLDRLQNRMGEARQHDEEALKIQRQLAQQNPVAYLPNVAATLNNLGTVDRLQNMIEESRAHYTEAVTIYRNLAQEDPERYAGTVASVEAKLRELDQKGNSQ